MLYTDKHHRACDYGYGACPIPIKCLLGGLLEIPTVLAQTAPWVNFGYTFTSAISQRPWNFQRNHIRQCLCRTWQYVQFHSCRLTLLSKPLGCRGKWSAGIFCVPVSLQGSNGDVLIGPPSCRSKSFSHLEPSFRFDFHFLLHEAWWRAC